MELLSACCSLWPITSSPSLASCWWPLLKFQEPKAFLPHLGRVKAIKRCFLKTIRLISSPCSSWDWHLISQPIPLLFCTHMPVLPLQITALPSNRKGNSPRRHGVKVPGHKLLSSPSHHLLHFPSLLSEVPGSCKIAGYTIGLPAHFDPDSAILLEFMGRVRGQTSCCLSLNGRLGNEGLSRREGFLSRLGTQLKRWMELKLFNSGCG